MEDSYKVRLEVFEGPMELLLHLIDKKKIDIYDIPIAELTGQYLAYLDEMTSYNIEVTSEFLVMAATLLQIKAKMMMPKTKEDDEEDEDPRAELVRRIIEYRRYKEVTEELSDMIVAQEKYCARPPAKLPEEKLPPNNLSVELLVEAFSTILKVKEEIAIPEVLVTREEFRIEDKMKDVLRLLQSAGGEILFSDVFNLASRSELIIIFLAVLELIRNNEVIVRQKQNFSEIYIFSKEGTVFDGNLGDT